MYLSIIIPCFNEEERIGPTLLAIKRYLERQTYQAEVIVVDNGSTDKTREIVTEFSHQMPNLRLIECHSHGKGYAVREGMLVASGQYRLFTDADNSTDISHADQLLSFARAGFDIVIGSRKAPGAKIAQPQLSLRAFLSNLFQKLVRLLVPLGVYDSQNGFKLFSEAATEKIFRQQRIFYWAFDVELLALGRRFGFKIKEVPITWLNDDRSGMTFSGMVRMLIEVITIRLHLWMWDYRP